MFPIVPVINPRVVICAFKSPLSNSFVKLLTDNNVKIGDKNIYGMKNAKVLNENVIHTNKSIEHVNVEVSWLVTPFLHDIFKESDIVIHKIPDHNEVIDYLLNKIPVHLRKRHWDYMHNTFTDLYYYHSDLSKALLFYIRWNQSLLKYKNDPKYVNINIQENICKTFNIRNTSGPGVITRNRCDFNLYDHIVNKRLLDQLDEIILQK